eukprot:CAMPEP_0183373866 /NCGR_PEP_ID=MMETSP0164_2-20130417/112761_1 /TAXON_ID=221442 /ORGANISM="Coccolithus pelagicus ssp braarudi, Strain PLY182g" /LENGTH=196 /DNA_ID=CAMNT_0025550811 /DNA_START=21 /DNA_END=608 /DNA_ORIENTATION=+
MTSCYHNRERSTKRAGTEKPPTGAEKKRTDEMQQNKSGKGETKAPNRKYQKTIWYFGTLTICYVGLADVNGKRTLGNKVHRTVRRLGVKPLLQILRKFIEGVKSDHLRPRRLEFVHEQKSISEVRVVLVRGMTSEIHHRRGLSPQISCRWWKRRSCVVMCHRGSAGSTTVLGMEERRRCALAFAGGVKLAGCPFDA